MLGGINISILEFAVEHSGIISLVLAPVFCLLGIVGTNILTKKQKPVSVTNSHSIINNLKSDFGELEVLYNKVKIDNLTKTRIYFWNAGRKSIRKFDLVEATPIMLYTPSDIDIYKINYIATPDLGKTLQVKETHSKGYMITFDAMQKDDGVYFEVLHSGSESCTVNLIGSIDNKVSICKSSYNSDNDLVERFFYNVIFRMGLPIILLCASIGFALYAFINRISLVLAEYFWPISMSLLLQDTGFEVNYFLRYIVFSILLMGLALLISWSCSRNIPIPNELLDISKKYNEYRQLYIITKTRERKTNQVQRDNPEGTK